MTAASIEAATPNGANEKDASLIARAETLLDRAHFSPGEIDGLDGDNYRSAIRAFQQARSLPATGELDPATWSALSSQAEAALRIYTISESDVAGPFTKTIPADLEMMAKLRGLSDTSPLAELSEKFYMSPELLRRLNPHADFQRAGMSLVVADVAPLGLRPTPDTIETAPPEAQSGVPAVAAIVVDKPARNVRAYDENGRLLGFYPATVGSEEKPAPSGTFAVRRVEWNPDFIYDPKFAWKGVKAKRKLTIRPGPTTRSALSG